MPRQSETNPFERAARAEKVTSLVPELMRALGKFGPELTSRNVGATLRGLAAEAWTQAAGNAGVKAPSAATIEAVILTIEADYEQAEAVSWQEAG